MSASRAPASLVAGATLALVTAVGCALGPTPRRPATAADGASWANRPPEETTAHAPTSPWWEGFADPVTSELVERALRANADIRVAAARTIEAAAALRQAAGDRWPEVTAGVSANRTRISFVLPQMGRVGIASTTYADDLSVSYLLDLFGSLKRSKQAAWASLLADQAACEAVEHAVVAEVVRSRVAVATLERSLALARRVVASWEETVDLTERRYRRGLAAADEVRAARGSVAAARADAASLEGQLAAARNALDLLVGVRPGAGRPLPATLPDVPMVAAPPLGLPAELLERRPDVRQAELELAAATYGIGVALADLFPSLSLTGSTGVSSDALAGLTSSAGVVYSAVARLVAPLFSGGRRRAAVEAARARAEAASAAYAGAVLQALREVEDALVAEATARRRLADVTEAADEAQAALRLARERYLRGVGMALALFDAERRLAAAEAALLTARSEVWNARVALYLALGGDWRHDDAAPPDRAVRGTAETDRPRSATGATSSSDRREVP